MELPFIPRDKLLHAVAGSIAAFVGVLLALYFTLPPINGAIAAALAAALGKEAWDLFSGKGTPEAEDLVATLAGSLPVVLTALVA